MPLLFEREKRLVFALAGFAAVHEPLAGLVHRRMIRGFLDGGRGHGIGKEFGVATYRLHRNITTLCAL